MEIWRKIRYNTNYSVSNLGRVRNDSTNKILIGDTNNCGYSRIALYGNKKYKSYHKRYFIHRLVATEFVNNPKQLPQVNHKDGNKQNNTADNLEWVTASENTLHAHRNHLADVTNRRPVYQLTLDFKVIRTFRSATEAALTMNSNLKNASTVNRAINDSEKDGKWHSVYGYYWCYVDTVY